MGSKIISKNTHQLILENENQLFYQDGKILLQEKKTGEMIYVALTEAVARAFDMKLEDTDANNIVESDEETATVTNESVDSSKLWTSQRTLFLIETIETFSERLESQAKKHVWEEISNKCNRILGISTTYKQVESKWKSLKRTYKSVLLHNNTSGKSRRYWEYFDKIHAFMHKRLEGTPLATCSSFSVLKRNVENKMATKADRTHASSIGNASDSDIENLVPSDLEIQTPERPPESSFIRKRRNRESEVSKRHKEKMARMDRFNDLFEKMVEKM